MFKNRRRSTSSVCADTFGRTAACPNFRRSGPQRCRLHRHRILPKPPAEPGEVVCALVRGCWAALLLGWSIAASVLRQPPIGVQPAKPLRRAKKHLNNNGRGRRSARPCPAAKSVIEPASQAPGSKKGALDGWKYPLDIRGLSSSHARRARRSHPHCSRRGGRCFQGRTPSHPYDWRQADDCKGNGGPRSLD